MATARFDLIIFDLDGTLVETREGIAASVGHALAAMGREPLDVATVVRYVGDGARTLMAHALGESARADEVDRALELFVTHYLENCLAGSWLYPEVAETLAALVRFPLPLAVVTNKPLAASERILERLGVRPAFFAVIGGDGAFPKKPDPAGVVSLVAAQGTSPSRTLLVGDTSVDVLTARAAGTAVAGVTYGFRPEDFDRHPPDAMLGAFREVLDLVGERV
jgi:phosphoglycolate phosphatase